jgi:hypothetical protein
MSPDQFRDFAFRSNGKSTRRARPLAIARSICLDPGPTDQPALPPQCGGYGRITARLEVLRMRPRRPQAHSLHPLRLTAPACTFVLAHTSAFRKSERRAGMQVGQRW